MATKIHKYSVQEAVNIKIGQGGYDIVSGATVNQTTNPNTTWVAIVFINGSTLTTATSTDTDVWDNISALEVPVGTTIYGSWSVITIGAGDTAICYRG
mgnify:CR=1 FL=1|tara:strand:- start:976 stop:1269 length:294 start_codon:yes stop_codon:yes gene_type:complete